MPYSYRPLKKGEDREKLKELLARSMEYGDSPEVNVVVVPKEGNPPIQKKLPTKKETWNDCKSTYYLAKVSMVSSYERETAHLLVSYVRRYLRLFTPSRNTEPIVVKLGCYN